MTAPGAGPTYLVWTAWLDGALLVVGGPGEQQTPGLEPGGTVEVSLRGRQHEVSLSAGDTVLESALKAGLEAPYACLGGACRTCCTDTGCSIRTPAT